MSDEAIPSQWLPVLEQRFEPGASLRDMALQIGMPHPTFIRVLKGKTSHRSIERVAAFLRIPVEQVYELRGETPTLPYSPPERSRHLSTTQRIAVDAVINAMLESVADQIADDKPDNVTALHPRSQGAATWGNAGPPPPVEEADAASRRRKKSDPPEDHPNE